MLTCEACGAHSAGAAWHWIGVVDPQQDPPSVGCFCPLCAETEYSYFSIQRARRLTHEPDLGD